MFGWIENKKNKAIVATILACGVGVEKIGLVIFVVGVLAIPITKGKIIKRGLLVYLIGLAIEIVSLYWEV